MGVGIRLFTMDHVEFLGIVSFVVLLLHVGCESLGFDSSVFIVLVWFGFIWMCSYVSFGGA